MITLQMMQFTAVVLMLLLTVKLLFLRERRIKSRQARQARRLMTTATALLSLHFAIQLNTGLRLMGITQSVMLNLAMLIPASHLFARAILLLQRRGKLSLADRWTGPAVWTVTMAMLAVAALTDGQPLLSDTLELRLAERAGAVLYMLMQGYYTWRHSVSLVAMHRALHDYYDRDTDGMLRWMQYSIVGLMLLALMVPVAIFSSGPGMLVVAFAVYFLMFYLVDSFCFYLTSPAPERMQAAEQNAAEVEEELKSLNNEKLTDAGTAYADSRTSHRHQPLPPDHLAAPKRIEIHRVDSPAARRRGQAPHCRPSRLVERCRRPALRLHRPNSPAAHLQKNRGHHAPEVSGEPGLQLIHTHSPRHFSCE